MRVRDALDRVVPQAWAEVLDPSRPREDREWQLAGIVARGLPKLVVLRAVQRMLSETQRPDDPMPVASLPVWTYLDRWRDDREPG